MCQAYCRHYGFNAISIMPTNLYGSGDNFDLENSHVLPALMRKFHLAKLVADGDVTACIKDEERYGQIPDDILEMLALRRIDSGLEIIDTNPKVMLWGSGSLRREFLHVDDLASASLFLMEHYDNEDIINVGVGDDIMIRELAEIIRQIVGFHGEIIWDRSKPDGTPRKLMDVSRINEQGWKDTIPLAEGIASTYQSYCR